MTIEAHTETRSSFVSWRFDVGLVSVHTEIATETVRENLSSKCLYVCSHAVFSSLCFCDLRSVGLRRNSSVLFSSVKFTFSNVL